MLKHEVNRKKQIRWFLVMCMSFICIISNSDVMHAKSFIQCGTDSYLTNQKEEFSQDNAVQYVDNQKEGFTKIHTELQGKNMESTESDLEPIQMIPLEDSESDFDLNASINLVGEGSGTETASSVKRDNWADYGDDYCYQNLNTIQQQLYDEMNQLCILYMNTTQDAVALTVKGEAVYGIGAFSYENLTSVELSNLVYTFIFQNPQFYFLANSVYYNSEIFYLKLYNAFADGTARSNVSKQFFSMVDSWVLEIRTESTQYKKEKKAHDIVCLHVDYQIGTYDQSAYSAVMEKKTVCAGYTKLYSILTNAAGLETVSVTSETHAWNRTKLGEKWYNVDTTWDDETPIQYTYFNKSDATLQEHSSSSAVSHTQNYYYNGVAPTCPEDWKEPSEESGESGESGTEGSGETGESGTEGSGETGESGTEGSGGTGIAGETEVPETNIPEVAVSYQTHVQTYGWQNVVTNGGLSGTSGKAKRLEAIRISVAGNKNLGIQYTTHCQTYGWLPWSANGEMNGTQGEAKRLEAIQIQLTGTDRDKYDVYYRVHAQTYGWLNWTKNGAPAGTAGYAKRLEAIQVVVVKKGDAAPGISYANVNAANTLNQSYAYRAKAGRSPVYGNVSTNNLNPYVPGAERVNVAYRVHVQSYGWQGYCYNGQMSGTSGQAKRLEAIEINLTNQPYDGDIVYTTHVQTYGWQNNRWNTNTWKRNGQVSGTSGQAKRLEAICISLTGEMAEHYDVYYRVHCQTYGWLKWTKNGSPAGTEGLGKRLEGIQIVLVKKDK